MMQISSSCSFQVPLALQKVEAEKNVRSGEQGTNVIFR